jgi:hypothetical protein
MFSGVFPQITSVACADSALRIEHALANIAFEVSVLAAVRIRARHADATIRDCPAVMASPAAPIPRNERKQHHVPRSLHVRRNTNSTSPARRCSSWSLAATYLLLIKRNMLRVTRR